ncbi:MAG TPA: class I SAM-dependent methyltransferase [Candidatus Eisenbacteria bacterium]|jgi:SAM-dependent methyltransferase|nr:class I SAM-dependent methyltransferase [Candidatus Eisenbacteria bacterium]
MFTREAEWIGGVLRDIPLDGGVVLDAASSSEEYRCVEQPYIDYRIFRPLRGRAVRIVYADKEPGLGVDVVADLTLETPETLRAKTGVVDAALCANFLEHVLDRAAVLRNLAAVLRPGGWLILTVPRRFPIHPHPIDTGYRPSTEELAGFLREGGFEVLRTAEVSAEYPWAAPGLALRVFNKLWRTFGGRGFLRRIDPGPYSVSCALARKPS